jgi:hypothetical protein
MHKPKKKMISANWSQINAWMNYGKHAFTLYIIAQNWYESTLSSLQCIIRWYKGYIKMEKIMGLPSENTKISKL